jgi:hypothetical protein
LPDETYRGILFNRSVAPSIGGAGILNLYLSKAIRALPDPVISNLTYQKVLNNSTYLWSVNGKVGLI